MVSLLRTGRAASISEKKRAIAFGIDAELDVGGAVCKRFAREGFQIFLAGRTLENWQAVATTTAATGGTATGLPPIRPKRPASFVYLVPQKKTKLASSMRSFTTAVKVS